MLKTKEHTEQDIYVLYCAAILKCSDGLIYHMDLYMLEISNQLFAFFLTPLKPTHVHN